MTVSPRRARDGERQPTASNNGVEADLGQPPELTGRSAAEVEMQDALPPTLFKMPNLNSSPPSTAAVNNLIDPEALADPTLNSGLNGGAEPTLTAEFVEADASTETQSVGSQTDAASTASPTTSPTNKAKPSDSFSDSAAIIAPSGQDDRGNEPAANPVMVDENLKLPLNPPDSGQSQPSGRTWAERIGSHALVIVMLLIVVAAAPS